MYFRLKDSTAEILAKSRRYNELCDLPLDLIASAQEAYDIQAAAFEALGFARQGYSIMGTTEKSRRVLDFGQPIYSEIPAFANLSAKAAFGLPPGVIGAQFEFLLKTSRAFPEENEPIAQDTVRDAIASCGPAIGLIGRRTGRMFEGDNAAIADFGLHVATICADQENVIDFRRFPDVTINVSRSGKTIATGRGSCVVRHPRKALVWLASELSSRGKQLQQDEFVTTGACAEIHRVQSGQYLAADFGPLGRIDCSFT